MALIKCKECGREISDKATACIHCGCPVNSSQVPSEEQHKPSKKKRWWVVGLAGVAVVAVAAAFLYNTTKDGNSGLAALLGVDEAAEVVITPEFVEAVRQYDQLEPFSDGMAAVGKNGKWGYINHKGEEVIPCQFDSEHEIMYAGIESEETYCVSHDFCDGVAVVRLNGKWGVIDKNGNGLIEDCHDGIIICVSDIMENAKCHFLNKKGEEIFTKAYSDMTTLKYSEGMIPVCNNGKYGYIDTKGNVVIPCQYSSASNFSEGIAVVNSSEDGFTCIDRQGNELFHKAGLTTYAKFHDGMLAVSESGNDEYGENTRYGFVNAKGELVIPCKYLSYWMNTELNGVFDFSEGYTWLYEIEDQYVFMDKTGKAVSFPYQRAYAGAYVKVFSEGIASVTDNKGKVGFMDLSGNLVIPFKYGECENFHFNQRAYGVFRNGVALVRMGDKWGYVDKNGNDTFTSADAEAFDAKLKQETEERRIQEERARQEEERLRREGQEVVISMSADVVDRQYFTNKQCNIGECSRRKDQLISRELMVPEGKVLLFKYIELDSRGTNLDYVRLFVTGTDGRERVYEVETCGEFPIFGGERYQALIHIYLGNDGNHVNAVYHFKMIDRDLY